ncbi:phage tail protein [Lactiplantibacillus plantarum]|uniref:phage tail protein n=1 Tax=Lactiplantibacillus plantarum TaxID=1590 RepID=UPI001EDB2E9F|nr:phage tail protein [Lactiplantibacillus plantarum]
MAESNATQVILTDDGIKIINAQNTADNAVSGVANLNDPNLMSVIEKQTQASQYAGLTSQYNVVLARAKEASISTTALTTAYTNLNTFMSAILTDTTKASDVNRDTYKSLTDAYNTALSNVQTALSNSFNTDISNMQSSVSVASQAASSAGTVASQATTTGNNASQVASQAASAANQASADYTALSAGVEDGSVIHITTKTAIDSAVIGTAEIADAAITDAKMGNISANHITTGSIDASKVTVASLDAGNITTGTLSTDRLDVDKLSALSANLGDVTTGSLKGVDIVANSFSTPNGSFTTDANGNVVASNLTIRGVTNLVYNAALLGGVGGSNPSIPGWVLKNGYYSTTSPHDGVNSIEFNSSTGSGTWAKIGQSKMYALTGLAGAPFSASVWVRDWGSDSSMEYDFNLAFYDSTGTRISVATAKCNGSSTGQDWVCKTIDNVARPTNAVYVGIEYWAYNGKGNAAFSSPMLTQTAQSTGYQPDTGNVVSAGEIDGSVINGSTINGTTFNAGSKLNQYSNTSYPLTINPDGSVTSTSFETIANETAALRTVIKDGTVKTNLRGMTPFSSGMYSAADVSLGAGQLVLLEGYSTAQDPNFDATGLKTTGYAILDASTGLSLHGSTQAI